MADFNCTAASCIHLESFLSQALGTPAVLVALALESMLLISFSWRRLLACGLVSAFVLAVYFEYFPVLVGATVGDTRGEPVTGYS